MSSETMEQLQASFASIGELPTAVGTAMKDFGSQVHAAVDPSAIIGEEAKSKFLEEEYNQTMIQPPQDTVKTTTPKRSSFIGTARDPDDTVERGDNTSVVDREDPREEEREDIRMDEDQQEVIDVSNMDQVLPGGPYESLMDKVVKMTTEMEKVREHFERLRVENAILLDDLNMAGKRAMERAEALRNDNE